MKAVWGCVHVFPFFKIKHSFRYWNSGPRKPWFSFWFELFWEAAYEQIEWKELLGSAFVRASPLFITISSTAISWSAVPEQPLDVTSDGFRQGTTKKRIGSHQSRCESVVISMFYLLAYLPSSAHAMLSEQKEIQRVVKGKGRERGKSHCIRERGQ